MEEHCRLLAALERLAPAAVPQPPSSVFFELSAPPVEEGDAKSVSQKGGLSPGSHSSHQSKHAWTGREWSILAASVGKERSVMEIKLHAHQYFLKLHASLGSHPPLLLPPTEAETVVAGGHINHHESLEDVNKAKVREGKSEKRDQEAILPLEKQIEPQGEESQEFMPRQGEQKECEHEGIPGNEDAKRQQEVQGAQQNINLVKICAESGIGAVNDGKKTVNGENAAENTDLRQENFIANPTTDGESTPYPQ